MELKGLIQVTKTIEKSPTIHLDGRTNGKITHFLDVQHHQQEKGPSSPLSIQALQVGDHVATFLLQQLFTSFHHQTLQQKYIHY